MAAFFVAAVAMGLANKSPDDEYSIAAIASASRSVIVLGPVLAMWAAFKVASLREYWTTARPQRNRVVVVLGAATWPLVLGPIVAMGATASAARVLPTSILELVMFGVVGMQAAAAALFGALVGRILPGLLAVPVAGSVAYFWLALLTSTDWATLRYLTGSFASCCTIDQEPAVGMLVGSTAFAVALGIGVCACLLWGAGRRWILGITAIAAVGLAVGVGLVVVGQTGPEPSLVAVRDRAVPARCGEVPGTGGGAEMELCLWPEHEDLRSSAGPVLAEAVERLRSAGVPISERRLSERRDGHALYVQVARNASPSDLRLTLALGLLPGAETCQYDPAGTYDIYATHDLALAWLSARAGLSDGELASRVDPLTLAGLEKLQRRPPSDQLAWITASRVKLEQDCGRTSP